ncbi:MAG: ABC transporter permease [Bacilli bacterium]|nr:ABC transporter permease [Bacilli bacterium]
MKNKFKFLTKQSLKRKVDTKWFKIVNVILCLIIICALNIDSIIKLFGGDFNENITVYVIDNIDGNVYDVFTSQIEASTSVLTSGSSNVYEIKKYDKTLEDAKSEVEENKNIIVLEFNVSNENVMEVTMLSKEYMDLTDMAILNTAINNTKVAYSIVAYNIDPEALTKIYENVEINRIFLDEEKNDTSENTEVIMTTVFPILILPFFMLSLILVQMIGGEVNDEKTTRSMEIIISNVSPETHLASKVVAGNLFVIIQGVLIGTYVILGLIVRKFIGASSITEGVGGYIVDIMDSIGNSNFIASLGYVIPLVLILLVITFVAYALLAGILASMTTNMEDFQQLQSPIVIISLAGYYLAMLAGMFKGSLFIRILSYIPFLSAILSPSLLVLGEVGVIDVIISIVIALLFVYWMIKYGIRIYKVGILNYSSKDLWKKMFKAMKNKNV